MVVQVSTGVRVFFAHAAVQFLADAQGLRLLHVKGPMVDPLIRAAQPGSDADILVCPADLEAIQAELLASGWSLITDFEEGSVWEHAATWQHPDFGYVDLHRWWPGFGADPGEAFEVLWEQSREITAANRPCRVPEPVAQLLIVLLHQLRSGATTRRDSFVQVPPEWWPRALDLAEVLGADRVVSWGLGEGQLDEGDPRSLLWRQAAGEVEADRLDEWLLRWRMAPGARAKLGVLKRSLTVPDGVLRMELGHPPTRRDRLRRQSLRVRRLAQGLRSRLRGWARGR